MNTDKNQINIVSEETIEQLQSAVDLIEEMRAALKK
jgi:hypothetical protein